MALANRPSKVGKVGTVAQCSEPAVYAWEGQDSSGTAVRGILCAGGAAVVSVTLRRQGIVVTKVKKMRRHSGQRIRPHDIALFTRQLATLMQAGVPLLQAFDIIAKDDGHPALARLTVQLRADIASGTNLHLAFGKFPQYFNGLFCSLINAGVQAGMLDELLTRLALHQENTLALQHKIRAALLYPLSVIVVALVVTVIIMTWVVPPFKDVFQSLGATLPAPTLFVLALSDALLAWWPAILGALATLLYGGWRSWQRSLALQRWLDRLLLRLPICGALVRKASIARWTRTLATMFAAGVPLAESLAAVGAAAGNALYQDATYAIENEVGSGTSLTLAMQHAAVFPHRVTQLVAIGEQAGALDAMLAKVADFYEQEVEQALVALASLIEPAMMTVLGLLLGALLVAMYLPIFKLGSVM